MEVQQRTPFSAVISHVLLYTQLGNYYRGPDLGDLNGGYGPEQNQVADCVLQEAAERGTRPHPDMDSSH